MANSLMSQIENIINSSILSFNMKVAKKYNIDVSELNELWANGERSTETQPIETPSQLVKSQSFSHPKPVQPQVTLTKSQTISSAPKKASPQEKTCPYSFSRGPNSGTVCGTKIKGEGNFCSKHKQYENKEQKGPKKVLPQSKKSPASSTASNSDDDEEEQRVREELNKKKTEGFTDKEINYMFFKKPELGENLSFHKQTGFVCNEKKLIIGKKTNDNRVIPLTEEDIKVAKSWNFVVKQQEEKKVEETKTETQPKIVKIVKPPVITKAQETKAQESKAQESKAQESKAQESKAQESKASVKTVKKFVIPVARLTTTKIEKSTLPVKENREVSQTPEKKPKSLNEEAKNTKNTISNIIDQQKDLEDILSDLTKGDEQVEEDNEEMSIKGSSDDEDDNNEDDIQEEDEILEDDE
jgi:hypothetical protein